MTFYIVVRMFNLLIKRTSSNEGDMGDVYSEYSDAVLEN